MIKTQGHRGARAYFPENTLPSFYGAIEQGYSFIETDTKFTKDDHCVILHDRRVNRTGRKPDGSEFENEIAVSDLTWEEFRKIDFGIHFDKKYAGTKAPDLEEVLSFVRETKMPIKFDNVIQSATDKQINSFFAAIKESGVEEYIGVTANTVDFVRRITDSLDKCIVYYDGPTSRDIYEELKIAAKGHFLSIWLPSEPKSWLTYPPATQEDVELARQYGEVGLWTAHDEESLRMIVKMRPDAMELEDGVKPEDVVRVEKEIFG